jgi:S-adenosylmethionine:tRNA ribosyltransferase-isomerase
MLVLAPNGQLLDRGVRQLPELLGPSDCLVVNDTRVRAARLRGRSGEHAVELLLVQSQGPGLYGALGRPGRRLRPGMSVAGDRWRAKVKSGWAAHPGGLVVEVETDSGTDLNSLGEMPLPPYLKEPLGDPERYQTVYSAGPPRSAAAPTAGLHLTHELLAELRRQGVSICTVRLEVGLATFSPIRSATIEGHQMHRERFEISAEAAAQIEASRRRSGRVVAVGTTVVRCLESCPDGRGGVVSGSGETGLYLLPGSTFQVVDGLLTNFHQPKSSLMVLVTAFFGEERVRGAYREAVGRGYRFLSFGDCMFGWAK